MPSNNGQEKQAETVPYRLLLFKYVQPLPMMGCLGEGPLLIEAYD